MIKSQDGKQNKAKKKEDYIHLIEERKRFIRVNTKIKTKVYKNMRTSLDGCTKNKKIKKMHTRLRWSYSPTGDGRLLMEFKTKAGAAADG